MNYIGKYITKNPQLPSPTAAPGIWNLDDALQYQKAGIWPPGYQISRSVRLRSSASAYFNRTLTTPTNNKIWTWSAWVKKGTLTSDMYLVAAGNTTAYEIIKLSNSSYDNFEYAYWNGSAYSYQIRSTLVLRDPSAWYHIVVQVDTTQATASNRVRMYVNNVEVTSFSISSYPSQNTNTQINSAIATRIGGGFSAGAYFDGYLTEINFIDGQALTPTSFGYTDTVSGVWQPLPYTGTYGANGFYLNFSDNSAATAAAIGKDYSGNGNNWTPNNISVTAGTTYDSMVDSPTQSANGDTGVGGEVRGNYAVLNPISNPNSPLYTVSNGNLTYSCSASAGNAGRMSIAGTVVLGTAKWYWECTPTDTNGGFGIGYFKDQAFDVNSSGPGNGSYVLGFSGGAANFNAGTLTYTGSAFSYVANDVIGLAYDGTANSLAFYKNGSLIGTYTGINAASWLPAIFVSTGGAATNFSINFGQRAFAYQNPGTNRPAATYKALCSTNLPTPTINNGAKYMAATTYSGNSASQSITNTVNSVSFQPDLVWVKNRSSVTNNYLWDSVRGVLKELYSNLTNAEATNTIGLSAFNSNGFTLNNGDAAWNVSGSNYVAWQWLAGAGTTSNIAVGSVSSGVPSIASTVSVNQTAGFSVVTYTGNGGSNQSVGHGLGVTPGMVIIKDRTLGTTNWLVHHQSQPTGYTLYLNLTNAQDSGTSQWGTSAQTSSVFYIGYTVGATGSNNSGDNYVAYCFAPIAGYSAFGSYTGNGSTDGPFVYLGFRPRFVLMKSSTLVTNWWIIDTARNTYNVANALLTPSNNYAEDTTYNVMDVTSNGFKIRTTYTGVNSSGDTYIYAAFAENPFKYARAR